MEFQRTVRFRWTRNCLPHIIVPCVSKPFSEFKDKYLVTCGMNYVLTFIKYLNVCQPKYFDSRYFISLWNSNVLLYLLSFVYLGYFSHQFLAFFMITKPVSYTHLRAHETSLHLVCRLPLEKKIFLMIRRPPRSTHCISPAASDVYKRQVQITFESFP